MNKKQLEHMWRWGCLRSLRMSIEEALQATIVATVFALIILFVAAAVILGGAVITGALSILEGIAIVVLSIFLFNIVTGTDWTVYKKCPKGDE